MRGRDFRIETMGFLKLPACLCTLTGPFESHAQVVVSHSEVGFEPDGLPVLGDGGIVLPFAAKCSSEIIVSLGELGFEPNGVFVLGDCGVVLPLLVKRKT